MLRNLSSQYAAPAAHHEDGADVRLVSITSRSPLKFLRGGGGNDAVSFEADISRGGGWTAGSATPVGADEDLRLWGADRDAADRGLR